MHDKEDIPALRWHIEWLEPGAGRAFQDNAGEQAEWLAHRNALRVLALQVTSPGRPPTARIAPDRAGTRARPGGSRTGSGCIVSSRAVGGLVVGNAELTS